MRDLGALPNPILTQSRAMDINNNFQIVGYSLANNVAGGGSDDHAVLWGEGRRARPRHAGRTGEPGIRH